MNNTLRYNPLIPQSKIVMSRAKDGADNPSPTIQVETVPDPDPEPSKKPSGASDVNDEHNTPVTTSPPPQEVYATELDIIDRSMDLALNEEELVMDGVPYPYSIHHRCVWYCDEKDGRGVVEFDLNKEFKTFTVNVGVAQQTKDTSQIGTFVVYVDGVEKARTQVGFGQAEPIVLDVSDGVRLKLVSSRDGEVTDPIQSGLNATQGDPNVTPDLVWGSPQLHR